MDTRIISNKLLEISPTGIVTMDASGEITYANKEAEKSLGLSKSEIAGLSYNSPEWKITTFDGNPIPDEELPFSQVRNKKTSVFDIEHAIDWPDGNKVYLCINASPITNAEGEIEGVIATLENVTRRVLTETKLKDSENKLLHAQELSNVGSWDYTFATDTVTWSKELFRIFERSEELGAPKYSDQRPFYTEESFEKMDKAVDACANHGIPYEIELDIITATGGIKNIISKGDVRRDSNGKIVGCYGTAQDITERKKLESALILAKQQAEKNEARYKGLLTNLETGVVVHNKDTSIAMFNARSSDLLGLNEDQMMGKLAIDPQWKFVNEDYSTLLVEDYPVMRVIKSKQPLINQVLGVKKPNSILTWLLVNGYPVLTNDGEIGEVIVSFIDVTARKQAEEALLVAKERAEESDRLKTAFLQNISHEIRTPLNAICGFSQMLNKQNTTEEQRNNYISLIQNNSDQLLAIISDVLAASSLETGQEKTNINEVNINETLNELVSVFNPRAYEKELKFSVKQPLSSKMSVIESDGTKLKQILTNLLSNAFKFTSSGKVELGYELKGQMLEFYVKDTGIGLHPDFHNEVFDRFRQADSMIQDTYGGAGLGLSISKGFVELLGGDIWIESELEKGSTFYFTIPYNPVNKNDGGEEEEEFIILVAEDQLINYLVIEGLLVDVPAKVIHAEDGQAAVDLYQSTGNVGLILMDFKMPGMRGDEAARMIKRSDPDIPIIAQSGYALEQERDKYEGVFDDYISKPISGNLLVQKVLEHMNIPSFKK